ncbi:hypothetical protein G9A89_006394 [Geosiphon pyriformis]|nr:hypothetical protein G9A89_006394 [Geosiphon pyriformis]
MHLVDLLTTVTYARDFEAAELEANHAQAVNLVMNGSSDLDSKLNQFSDSINQKLKKYLADNHPIYHRVHHYQQINCCNKKHEFAITVINKITLEPIAEINIGILIAATHNISTAVINSLSTTTNNSNTTTKPSYDNIWKPQIQSNPKLEIGNGGLPTDPQFNKSTIRIMPAKFKNWNYLSLLVTPEDMASSKQKTNQKPLIHNILPATSTKDESLATIFPFKLEEIMSVLLFSRAALDIKPITTIYTDAKVNGQYIKLILNSRSADSIITKQLMNQLAASARIITADRATKTPIDKIDDFSFEVNGIIIPIKVLVMEATQYQALVGNNWLTKTNTILNWTMQKLQLSQNKAYQVLWTDDNHNELLPILSWDNNTKGKQREKLTWETDNLN